MFEYSQEGKCEGIRKERFLDSGAIPVGDFYIVRSLPGHLPSYLNKPVSKEKSYK